MSKEIFKRKSNLSANPIPVSHEQPPLSLAAVSHSIQTPHDGRAVCWMKWLVAGCNITTGWTQTLGLHKHRICTQSQKTRQLQIDVTCNSNTEIFIRGGDILGQKLYRQGAEC
eukprot:EG_transcript_21215